MTTRKTADWLAATIASDLSITCQKSMPAFDRPDVAAGAYIGWISTTPMYGERVSSSLDRWEMQFSLLVVATNELALWTLIDNVEIMAASRVQATIDGASARIRFAPIERAVNEYDTDALRYAAQTTIQFVR